MLITSQHYSDSYLETYVLNTHTRTHKLNKQFYLDGEDSCDGNLSSSSLESPLSEFVCSSSRTNCTLPDVALALMKVASHLKCSYFGSKWTSSLPVPLFPSAFRTYLENVVLILTYLLKCIWHKIFFLVSCCWISVENVSKLQKCWKNLKSTFLLSKCAQFAFKFVPVIARPK